ncbi:rare lipoprotein A [Neorhizobium galegae]|uniref:septal ring lytic transglycosylase RlpA family protein n=1 Tax=Neorhizobium galegae TaxID=399 RepID=UPI001EC78EE2|nr:septal ring lytic transglycosylase RlpA family protein [Neorhizobium galegae]MBP2558761.1 rare lipoprotein A [Neorhizobium galegae]
MSLGVSGGKLSLGAKWLGVTMVCAGMASCATTEAPKSKPRSKEYFSEKEYGVKASPRVVGDGRPVPKGGGRFMVGQPYEVKGQTYVPKEDPNYNRSGLASWYGSAFHGRLTANGEVYDSEHLSAAHPTFPLPSYARVTNIDNGTSVIVRVNDRGPYHPGRIIDVSDKTAEMLDMKRIGTAHVNVQYVGRARMDGKDMPFLMASYIRKGDRLPSIRPEGQIATGVMVASNQTLGDQLQSYGSAMPRPIALAGRTPSAPAAEPSAPQAFEAFENFSTLPPVGPLPMERPVAGGVPTQARQVASSYPVETQARPLQARSLETAYSSAPPGKNPAGHVR